MLIWQREQQIHSPESDISWTCWRNRKKAVELEQNNETGSPGGPAVGAQQCWRSEGLLLLLQQLKASASHERSIRAQPQRPPPASCATSRGSLQPLTYPQSFPRVGNHGDHGEELGSGYKFPCVWGPQFYSKLIYQCMLKL